MKRLIVSICVFYLATHALASIRAGPYQTMLAWYAYRMDIKIFGFGQTFIAPGCKGSAPDGSCLFDEFLRHIQRSGRNTPSWTGHTTVGADLNPDVLDTAKELSEGGVAGTASRYNNVIEPSELFPSKWNRGTSPTFGDIFQAIVDNIQICRKEVQDVGIEDEVDHVRRAIISVQDARYQDQATVLLANLNERLAKAGRPWKAEEKIRIAPDGSPWMDINTEATIEAHPEETVQFKQSIIDYVAGFDTMDKVAQNHAKAIQQSQLLGSRLLQDYNC